MEGPLKGVKIKSKNTLLVARLPQRSYALRVEMRVELLFIHAKSWRKPHQGDRK